MITVDFSYLQIPPQARVLDIGCGSGRHTTAVFDRGRSFIVGADANESDLRQTGRRLHLHKQVAENPTGRWALSAADATRLPFADACFDVVICAEVLEHIHLHRRAVTELTRVLKPSGDLVISVPRHWPERLCWMLSRTYRNTPGGHIRIYRAAALIRMVRSAGFRHRRTHHAHSLHAPYWWLKCLLGVERDTLWPVRLYHRFLTWDMMQQPRLTHNLERLLNPVMGKSVVLYFRKSGKSH
jgi:2-polyprenyl-3-methyl-5-hydroxy-6-metoxy-1,4-benzoquinol methylase